jgi:hypothetical protein
MAARKNAPPPPVEDDDGAPLGEPDDAKTQPQQTQVVVASPSMGSVPPAPAASSAPGAPSAEAKARAEALEEERRTKLRGQYADVIQRLGAHRSEYSLKLYRRSPEWQGRYRVAGLLETYEAGNIPTEMEIAEKHGGYDYRCVLHGPNPDNPREQIDVTVNLQVSGFPTTHRHNGSLMPLPPDAYQSAATTAQDAQSDKVMDLVKSVMEQNQKNTDALRKEMAEMLAPKPLDPEVVRAEAAAAKMAHEKEMKRLDLEAEERREARKRQEKIDDERRAEERAARDAASKRELEIMRMQHDANLEAMKLKSKETADARAAEIKRDEDMKRTFAEAQQRMADMMAASTKQLAEVVAKVTEVEKTDPIEALTKTILAVKSVGELMAPEKPPAPEPPSQGMEIAKMILPKFMATADKLMDRLGPSAEKKPAPAIKPGTVMRSPAPARPALPAPAAPVQAAPALPPAPEQAPAALAPAPEKPAEPVQDEPAPPPAPVRALPQFVFPDEGTDAATALRRLGDAVALALDANMMPQAIYNHVVTKFRSDVLDLVVGQPKETALSTLNTFAPDGSVLLTPRGQMTVKLLYSLVKNARKPA